MKILKGAYGLTEAPRLWYLRARELMIEVSYAELCCTRAVFILRDTEETVAMLTLHVDDVVYLPKTRGTRGTRER